MRSIICWAVLAGLVCGAVTASLPAQVRRERIWINEPYTPGYRVPSFKAPVVKVSRKALPKLIVEYADDYPAEPAYKAPDPHEGEEAKAAAIRYALAHNQTVASYTKTSP
jgi:hypothetical protein